MLVHVTQFLAFGSLCGGCWSWWVLVVVSPRVRWQQPANRRAVVAVVCQACADRLKRHSSIAGNRGMFWTWGRPSFGGGCVRDFTISGNKLCSAGDINWVWALLITIRHFRNIYFIIIYPFHPLFIKLRLFINYYFDYFRFWDLNNISEKIIFFPKI